jgi:hypothetical protein
VDDGILNGSCLDWLSRTANAKVHGTTKRIPAEVFKEECEHLRPLVGFDEAVHPVVCRTVRKDNTIIYDSNRYSVPLGTYNKQPEVRIETKEGIFTSRPYLASRFVSTASPAAEGCSSRAKAIQETAQQALDKLQNDLDTQLRAQADRVFAGIRTEKARYSRDQFRIVQSMIDQYGVPAVLEAVDFCEYSNLSSANILKDYLTHKAKENSERSTVDSSRCIHYSCG